MTEASVFYDVAQMVLDCVCGELGDTCPCRAYVSPGEPPIDCCTDDCSGVSGQLTVHIEDIFPSDEFPLPVTTFEPCKARTWVASVVITAARCSPVMDEQGDLVPGEELSANAQLMAEDSLAIMSALACCVVNTPPGTKRKRRVKIEGTRPGLSDGGCSFVEVRVLVDIGPVCTCSEVS